MAASTAGALKAFIEGLGLSISAYRDQAPDGVKPPYISIIEAVTLVPDIMETDINSGTERAQVDVWQTWRNADNSVGESYTLVPSIVRQLHGARLTTAPTTVYACLIRNRVRQIELDNNLVHDAITVEIKRVL